MKGWVNLGVTQWFWTWDPWIWNPVQLETFKSDKGKVISSNFQERYNWEKARKNMNENNAFYLPFIVCFIPSSQYQILKANTYSILTNGNQRKLGLPVLEPSTKILKFYEPSDSEHKHHKMRIKNWLSIAFELGSPWMRTCSHNNCTVFKIYYDGES